MKKDKLDTLPIIKDRVITYPLIKNITTFSSVAEARAFAVWHPLMDEWIYDDGDNKYLMTKKKI